MSRLSKEDYQKSFNPPFENIIVDKFLHQDICKAKLGKELGKGAYGSAYLALLDGDANEYVIKKVENQEDYDSDKLVYYAHDNCSNEDVIVREMTGNITTYPNAYLCENTIYTEYINSRIASTFDSFNFTESLSFDICKNPKSQNAYEEYTLMEKIDTTLRKLINNEDNKFPTLKGKDLAYITIQVMFALCCMQSENVKMSHNDLHDDNVFIKIVNDNTTYKGKRLRDYKYLEFKFGDSSFCLPTEDVKYIVKIGDWGLSSQFGSSKPFMNKDIVTRFRGHHAFPMIPDYYLPAYDVCLFLKAFSMYYDKFDFFEYATKWAFNGDDIRTSKRFAHQRDDMNMNLKTANVEFAEISALNFFKQGFVQEINYDKEAIGRTRLVIGSVPEKLNITRSPLKLHLEPLSLKPMKSLKSLGLKPMKSMKSLSLKPMKSLKPLLIQTPKKGNMLDGNFEFSD